MSSSEEKLKERGDSELEDGGLPDPFLVSWDSSSDPANPRNWSSREKWSAALIVATFAFLTPLSSTMLSNCIQDISHDLSIGSEAEAQIVFSIYVLAWGTSPMLLSPLSEIYGRIPVLQVGNLIFIAFGVASGVATSVGQLVTFRLISGFGGGAVLAVDDGLIADLWHTDEMGSILAIYSYLPLIGPALGPILGALICQYSSWRWAFFALAIATAVASLLGLFFFRETYAPLILRKKAQKMRKQTGDQRYHAGKANLPESVVKTILQALGRPLKLCLTQPIIIALSLYLALIWGVLYLVLSTFGSLFTTQYHQSTVIGSLHYLALGIGLYIGTQIGASVNNRMYDFFKRRNDGQGSPELRAPMMALVSPLIPIGCLWYGWSAQGHAHWIMPDIGVAIFGIGGLVSYQGTQAYVLEAYQRYAASAISATTFVRSISGFVFPIFAPQMYNRLGYGWGNTLLALLALLFGLPAPVLLYFFGKKLRAKSKCATDSITDL